MTTDSSGGVSDDRLNAIVETLRFLSDGCMTDPADNRWLGERADEIESDDWRHRASCPLCSEIRCDDNCPMLPIRHVDG